MDTDKNLIYVTTYPKSGSTWFKFLIYALYHGRLHTSDYVNKFYTSVNNFAIDVNFKLSEANYFSPSEFFIKSHNAYSPHIDFHDNIKAVILIARDPFN